MAIRILLLLLIFLSSRKSVMQTHLYWWSDFSASSFTCVATAATCLVPDFGFGITRQVQGLEPSSSICLLHFLPWRETWKLWKSRRENREKANAEKDGRVFWKNRGCPSVPWLQRHLHGAEGGFRITSKKQLGIIGMSVCPSALTSHRVSAGTRSCCSVHCDV